MDVCGKSRKPGIQSGSDCCSRSPAWALRFQWVLVGRPVVISCCVINLSLFCLFADDAFLFLGEGKLFFLCFLCILISAGGQMSQQPQQQAHEAPTLVQLLGRLSFSASGNLLLRSSQCKYSSDGATYDSFKAKAEILFFFSLF